MTVMKDVEQRCPIESFLGHFTSQYPPPEVSIVFISITIDSFVFVF